MVDNDPKASLDQRAGQSWATNAQRIAWVLSLSGFIPFAGCALALLFLSPDHAQYGLAADAMKTYGAVILSFLGGTRWGLALQGDAEKNTAFIYVASIVPSLVGWFSLLLPAPYVFAALALAFLGQGIWDSKSGQVGVISAWFVKLRITLTILVTGSLLLAVLATAS